MAEKEYTDGKQYAKDRLGPDGKPLQVWPLRKREEFDSVAELVEYIEEVSRFNNNVPPTPRSVPDVDGRVGAPTIGAAAAPVAAGSRQGVSRKVGVRLTPRDHDLLVQLASEHAVTPSTMARILVAKGVRSAYAPPADE